MTAEQISFENPRTEKSFFKDSSTYQTIIEKDAEFVSECIRIEPQNLIAILHELWRAGKDGFIYDIVGFDKDLFTHYFMSTLDLPTAMAGLHINTGETLVNCESYVRDIIPLVMKATLGLPFEDELSEKKLEVARIMVNTTMSSIKEIKIDYISQLN